MDEQDFIRELEQLSNVKKKKWKVLDLFSGAGGLSNGFEQTGNFEVFGAVENNEAAINTYIKNHDNDKNIILRPEVGESSDITKIDFGKVLEEKGINPSETIILGGPPCQGFSNVNRQRNHLISGNNLLVKEFARAVYQVKPAAFLMENVKTMNSSVHKFFVQKDVEAIVDISKPSRRKNHLEWLNKNGKKIIKLNEEDQIVIANIGKDGIPEEWANYILKNHSSLSPIISLETNISLLRSLERRSRKKQSYNPPASIKKQLMNLVNEKVHLECEPWTNFLSDAVLNIFEPLSGGESLDLNEHHETLRLIVMLNTALTNFKELRDNEIDVHDISIDLSKRVIQALVTTYSVVEYLEAYFELLGYKLVKSVLTASDFGVPQKRNRFFILGIKSEKEIKLELPSISGIKTEFTVHHAIADLEDIEPSKDVNENFLRYRPVLSNSPLLKYYRSDISEALIFNHVNTDSREQILKRYEAIRDREGRNSRDVQDLFKNEYSNIENIQNTVYLRLSYDTPSPTVVNVRKSMWSHPVKARAISIREAARLQSFKDTYLFEGKKDEQYQQIGNAVPPLLARVIAEKLLETLGDEVSIPIKDEFGTSLIYN